MKSFFLAFAAALLLPSLALALPDEIQVVQPLDDQAINDACAADPAHTATASVTCAAFQVDMRWREAITVEIDYTYSAATAIQIIIESSAVGGAGPWAVVQLNADTSTVPDVTLSAGGNLAYTTGAASGTFAFTLLDVNVAYLRFRITSTSGDASDVVDVYYTAR